MIKKLSYIALAFILALASCKKESVAEGEGGLRLRVSVDADVKAAITQEELMQSAVVNIYKADFSGLVRSYKYSEIPETIYLAADDYRVDVLAGERVKENPATVSWDAKSYKGSTEVTIGTGVTKEVKVEAKVCNIITKVSFDGTVAAQFNEGYTMRIGLDLKTEGMYAEYTAGDSGKEAYFLTSDVEPSLYWEFKGVRTRTAEEITRNGEILSAQNGTVYKLNAKYTVTDGDASFDIVVDTSTDIIDDLVVFEPASSGLVPSKTGEIWAWKAYLHAEVDESSLEEGTTIRFALSSNGTDWTEFDAQRSEAGEYGVCANNLTPDTQYTYKLLIGGEQVGEALTLHTEVAKQAPNASFETFTSGTESSKFKSFYDPESLYPELRKKWWDNGNHGSTTLSSSQAVCVPDNSTKVDGEYSVKCASQYVVIKFAAGSMSSCEYGGTKGTDGFVNFGRPFTSRPSALRMWVKYSGGQINRGSTSKYSGPDKATFIGALGTWPMSKYGGDMSYHPSDECPLQVYSADESTFWKYDQLPETIAYVYHETESEPEWTQITLPFEYYKTDEIPTHIVLSFAASKYGDYFTGCDSATLWIDKVELLYEDIED